MKIVMINTCSFGSTGNIATQLCKLADENGNEAYLSVPNGRHNKNKFDGRHIWIGGRFSEDSHIILSRITGYNGCFSYFATKKYLRKLDEIKPDLIHLHNLHNSYINLPLLFKYIKERKIPVVWTLHDCWAFTGHCPYFTFADCDKWKTQCCKCLQYKSYPQSLFDNSKKMYNLKRKLFTGVDNLILVTPSQWLKDLCKKSFLKDYKTAVINNGIDTDLFRPIKSEVKQKYQIPKDKFTVLGSAINWEPRKGIDVFVKLCETLDKEKYQIVLTGVSEEIKANLPQGIISLPLIKEREELAKIYSAADVFVNPTKEDNFPTVNIESLACGTPVITSDVGGSGEMIDTTCGMSFDFEDFDKLKKAIISICEDKKISRENCRAHAEKFNKDIKFMEYIKLYADMI